MLDDYALILEFGSLNTFCDCCLTNFFMNKINVTVQSSENL